MNIEHFSNLLAAAKAQPLPQRLLFVFDGVELPVDASAEQRAAFAAGHGGTLTPRNLALTGRWCFLPPCPARANSCPLRPTPTCPCNPWWKPSSAATLRLSCHLTAKGCRCNSARRTLRRQRGVACTDCMKPM